MEYEDGLLLSGKQRIIQELVPGRQVSLAHIIANPDKVLYARLGMGTADGITGAIGILTVSPAETAIIMGDIAIKSSGAGIAFLDYTSGSLIVNGTVSEVEAAVQAVLEYVRTTLDFSVCPVTRT